MSIDRWMDKKLWYMYTMENYSAIKRNTSESVLMRVNEPRTYYTEWSESEREREILYSNTYIRNLEEWYWRIYLQGSSGETDIENRFMDMVRGEERVRCMKRVTRKLTLPYVKWIANGNLLYGSGNSNGFYQFRGVGWGRRWEGGSEGKGYMYEVHVEV